MYKTYDEKDVERIKKYMEKFTEDLIAQGPEVVRKYLIETLGCWNEDGTLKEEWGGGFENDDIELIDKQIDNAEGELKRLEERKQELLGWKYIECAKCNHRNVLNDMNLIQTHWYVQPYSCTNGDYWNEGETNFICTGCNTRNRLLFDTYSIPYEDRQKYENNKEMRFKRIFKPVVREIELEYNKGKSNFVNNFYVDKRFNI